MTLMVLIQLPARDFVILRNLASRALIPLCFSPFLNPSWSGHWVLLTAFRTFPAQSSKVFCIPPSQFRKPVNDTAVIPLLMQVLFPAALVNTPTIATKRERVYLAPCCSSRLLFIIAGKSRWQGLDVGSLSHGQDTEKMNEWSDAQFIQSTISCLVNGTTHSEQFPSSIKIIKMIPHNLCQGLPDLDNISQTSPEANLI